MVGEDSPINKAITAVIMRSPNQEFQSACFSPTGKQKPDAQFFRIKDVQEETMQHWILSLGTTRQKIELIVDV